MTADAPIDLITQRETLRVALHNAGRTVPLQMLAVGFLVWLALQSGATWLAALMLVLGLVVGGWRLAMARRYEPVVTTLPAERIAQVVHQLEANAGAAGLLWVLASTCVYPRLPGELATIYLVMACGSLATAAFFMSLAGRSFVVLNVLLMGSLVLASLLPSMAPSWPLALLTVVFAITMDRTTRELRAMAVRALRQAAALQINAQALQAAKEAAEAAEAAALAKSQFLATLSHEIRTPLNGVLGALGLLQQSVLDVRQQQLVRTAAASGDSLLGLLSDMLDHSRIESALQLRLAPPPAPLRPDGASAEAFDARAAVHGVVLLAEDNPVNRLICTEMLRSFGLEVLECENGAEAVALLERQRADLVLMDIQMPVLDGYAATRQLRERESRLRLPRVPIVAITANAFDEDAERSMAAGMDEHLAKPFSREQLLALVRRWV